jgi:sulfate transport system ATP-binding protein
VKIDARGVRKSYPGVPALCGVDVTCPSGELTALLGPSGSGKTTLLRVIAGLESMDDGVVLFDGQDQSRVRVRDRRVGFVFQHYALFTHQTVFDNVAFGLRIRPWHDRPGQRQIRERVEDLLTLVQLDHCADRYPGQLSGGQRQRVALARALAIEPRVLLLDEPFGALDARVRRELRRWLRSLHEALHVTTVLVTHDQEEALELADQVVILERGSVAQCGSPDAVYAAPASPFVYDFLGDAVRLSATAEDGRLTIGDLDLPVPDGSPVTSGRVDVCLRPHQFQVTAAPEGSPSFPAEVVHVQAAGPRVEIALQTRWGDRLWVDASHDDVRRAAPVAGGTIHVRFHPEDMFLRPVASEPADNAALERTTTRLVAAGFGRRMQREPVTSRS